MSLNQIISVALIMVLSIGPALSAECNLDCMGETISAVQTDMQGMEDCNHCPKHEDEEGSDSGHKHCNMAGCHISSSIGLFTSSVMNFPELQSSLKSHLISRAISAELPPPIKPPA